MPMTSLLTDKIAVLRAMVTNDNAHSSSGYQMMTGVPHVPLSTENAVSKAPNLAPHWGSVTKYLNSGFATPRLPPAITIPIGSPTPAKLSGQVRSAVFSVRRTIPG